MNQHSLTRKKYHLPLIGAALAAASLFHFSLPVFAAGTQAGRILRNTATGSYKDDAGNPYTIESNTVEVTVAKVAGITNLPTGFDDLTSTATNTTVLTGDRVSFEFTISNVGNDKSNIFIPDLADISTKGLIRTTTNANDSSNFVIQVSPALTATGTHSFAAIPATGTASDPRPATGIVEDVPINGKVIVRVTSTVSATAAGAPIEVRLGDTPPNTDPNSPLAATQNQPDAPGSADSTDTQTRDIRTENATNPSSTVALVGGQKEASALQQVFLGSNPLAMTRIEKTRGAVIPGTPSTDLSKNVIPYSLNLEVLNTTPNSLYTPGDLEGRDFASRITGIPAADASNLILVSDAIPDKTELSAALTKVGNWTPIYSTATTGTPFTMQWTTTAPTLSTVTRVGWVYDARPTPDGKGPIASGTTITAAQGGFTFNVVTSGLTPATGGTVANVAQVFGGTVNGVDIFDESGDQDPSNFNGTNLGPNETDALSTGIANPATHGVDSGNDNNTAGADPASPGGEDNVITIGAPGQLINGPDGKPTATGNVFGIGPDNNHDFQNLGVSNFPTNAQHNAGTKFDPAKVVFKNTLSNPGSSPLSAILLQPIQPSFGGFGGTDANLPELTKVTINLGTQQAIYTYTKTGSTFSFILDPNTTADPSQPITIPTLAAGVPLDYTVTVDLPSGTGLSTDDTINRGFAVPIIAFIDGNNDGTPDTNENRNLTVNQVYTGHIKVSKQVRVLDSNGDLRSGMNFDNPSSAKQPLPGDTLEYRVIYRNISEPQVGSGNNGVLNGVNVMIDEDGTLDAVDGAKNGNNWGLDNNADNDLDTINVQNSAADTNNGTINFFTGNATTPTPLSSTAAGTTDPGDTVTGYRSTVPLLAPAGTEATAELDKYNAPGDSAFTFQRKVDKFDGLGAEGLTP